MARPVLSRQDVVSQALRRCALVVDPRYGRLSALAETLDLHESTLNKWISAGRVPRKPCRQLVRRFGREVNRSILSGEAE